MDHPKFILSNKKEESIIIFSAKGLKVNFFLTICILETPTGVLWQTVKTQMKCHILRHFIWFFTVYEDKIQSSGTDVHNNLEVFTCDPLKIYNGQSHPHCIYLYGKIHQNTKG